MHSQALPGMQPGSHARFHNEVGHDLLEQGQVSHVAFDDADLRVASQSFQAARAQRRKRVSSAWPCSRNDFVAPLAIYPLAPMMRIRFRMDSSQIG